MSSFEFFFFSICAWNHLLKQNIWDWMILKLLPLFLFKVSPRPQTQSLSCVAMRPHHHHWSPSLLQTCSSTLPLLRGCLWGHHLLTRWFLSDIRQRLELQNDDLLLQESMPMYHPSPNVTRAASQLTEEEQVKIAKRIGLIQHLPTGTYDGCKKNRE